MKDEDRAKLEGYESMMRWASGDPVPDMVFWLLQLVLEMKEDVALLTENYRNIVRTRHEDEQE